MHTLFIILLLLCLNIFTPAHALAKLIPEEIAVLVNTNSPDSLHIGELYVKLRNVPANHLIKVSVSTKEHISRKDYDELIAEPVRAAINRLYNKGAKIRCLLTTFGIPLRIGAARPFIIPEGQIEKYSMMKTEKEEKISELNKRIKRNEGDSGELKKKIRKLKDDIQDFNIKIGHLKGSDTVSAVDSELAMLLVPGYTLAGWQANPEHLQNRGRINYFGMVLMVSRLDAPTPELVEYMLRTAIDVERTGLTGKVYLDARGKTGVDDYSKFDENIRITAKILQGGTMPVILDNRPALFGHGEAVSAALYCGWYSLGKYVDAFEWSKGAVGYHVASSEAKSLHNRRSQYWVKSMLERGVIATIGPVTEPYLHSFPLPSQFFPLLMSGRYTLAEVFAMTNPLLSWRMILVGDPLYNPFKNKPAFALRNPPPAPD